MRVIAAIQAVNQASKRWPTKREITTPHSPALAIHTRFAAGCRHTTNTQSPNSYQLGFFLPVPPVKTAMTSRASLRRRRVFRPNSLKFLPLLSVGTRALATPLRVFSRTYRQQVRQVFWSGGRESKKDYFGVRLVQFGLIFIDSPSTQTSVFALPLSEYREFSVFGTGIKKARSILFLLNS